MTTPWPPRRTVRSPLAPRIATPREPVDPARTPRCTATGEGDGRRRSRGGPRGHPVRRRQDSRHEDLADDVRGLAELAADAAAAAAREAEHHEAARVAARADELQALRGLGTLEQTEPRTRDEAVRDELTRRADGYVQADVDAWLAHALAAHLGHYRDPAAREPPLAFSPRRSSHTPRCSPNSRLVPDVSVDQLAFAARLTTAEPEAVGDLAVFLARVR
ncbi:hypothetical protein ACG2OD_37850 [Streptomyces sp. PDY-4]|uniref:hypothetical protein n=1 Tax=Streptomyces sp. PDY-4 TaxID=3376070 RepID=UPI00379A1DB5